MPFAMDDIPGHATPSAAQLDALVAELERVEPLPRRRACPQRVDVLLWCPQAAADVCTRLLHALRGVRLRRYPAAPRNADALLWVNARGAPLVVRVRDALECFGADRPAPRVVVCTSPRTDANELAHPCTSGAFAALDCARDFDGVALRLLHWADAPLPPALAAHQRARDAKRTAAHAPQ